MKTRITELFGIKHPIVQAPANYVGFPQVVAAASNAGGLGMLATGLMTPDSARKDIKTVRELTNKPFGVNLVAGAPGYEDVAQVLVEERVPIIAHARGHIDWLIPETKAKGIKVIQTVGAVRHAVNAEKEGVDALIVQGTEAGGGVGYVATMVLLPLIADKVKIPVVAAGGFCDGKGLVAALALGAEGIAMGTRMALSRESILPDHVKQRYIEATEADTVVTSAIIGSRLRVLRNQLVDSLEETGQKGLSRRERISSSLKTRKELDVSWWRFLIGGWRMKKSYGASMTELASMAAGGMRVPRALIDGDADLGVMPSGQVCGRINDILSVQEIIETTVAEAQAIMESLKDKLV